MKQKPTQEERIAIIRDAHQNSQSISLGQSAENLISEIKVENIVCEHGLLNVQKNDLEDESQFLFSDSAEEIDEEDQDFGISPEMRKVQKQN
jgi:hypothetical protein